MGFTLEASCPATGPIFGTTVKTMVAVNSDCVQVQERDSAFTGTMQRARSFRKCPNPNLTTYCGSFSTLSLYIPSEQLLEFLTYTSR